MLSLRSPTDRTSVSSRKERFTRLLAPRLGARRPLKISSFKRCRVSARRRERFRSDNILILIPVCTSRRSFIIAISPLGLLFAFQGRIFDQASLRGPGGGPFPICVVTDILEIAVEEFACGSGPSNETRKLEKNGYGEGSGLLTNYVRVCRDWVEKVETEGISSMTVYVKRESASSLIKIRLTLECSRRWSGNS